MGPEAGERAPPPVFPKCWDYFGNKTRSIEWITPFDWITS